MESLKIAAKRVKRQLLVSFEYVGVNNRVWEQLLRFARTWGFNKDRQFKFIQDFSTWLNDGNSPALACRSIAAAGEGYKGLQQEVKAAKSIEEALAKGLQIKDGMLDWFDPEVVSLFDAGQQAGKEALTRVVNEYLKQEEEIKNTKAEFWKPIKQPLVYFFMVSGFMVMMGLFILPEFSSVMPAEKMSDSAKFVVAFSGWFESKRYWFGFFGILFYLGLRYFMENNTSNLRIWMDNYFPLSIYKNFAAMRTLKTLGILVETRYNLHAAAVELKRYSSNYMAYHLNHIIRETQYGGSDLGTALDSGWLSKGLMFRLRNAAKLRDQERKKGAISIAADRSGVEAVRALSSTRINMAIALWLAMAVTLLVTVSAFMGVISSLFSLSYR